VDGCFFFTTLTSKQYHLNILFVFCFFESTFFFLFPFAYWNIEQSSDEEDLKTKAKQKKMLLTLYFFIGEIHFKEFVLFFLLHFWNLKEIEEENMPHAVLHFRQINFLSEL